MDTNELRQFSQTFWINSCVQTVMDEVTTMDWCVKAKDDWDHEWVKDKIDKVENWLKYPNKNREPFNSVLRSLLKDIMELDAGVLVKVFSIDSYDFNSLEPKSGAPMLKGPEERQLLELYARDGASFLKETDKFGFTAGFWQYSYQIPAHPMWFNRDEICYISRNARSMSVYGYAPTQAIMDIVKSLHYSVQYNRRFFEENSIPDGVLSVLDTNEVDLKNFADGFTRQFQAQPHKFAIFNKDIKWTPFTVSQRELEFLETQNWYYKLVISAFGLTPAELGLTDDVNRSTSATQAELSRRKGIRPLLELVENFINAEIIPEFGYEGIEFSFIYDDPAEKAQRLNNWQIELNAGIKTVNEVREEMGLDPIEGGDLPRTAFGSYQQTGEGPQEDANSQDKKDNKGNSETSEEGNLSREEGKTEKSYNNDYSMINLMKLEDELIRMFKQYHGEKTNEFLDIERKFYNTQSTGEYKFNEYLEIKRQLENLLNKKFEPLDDKERDRKIKEESDRQVLNPFRDGMRPVGSFKGISGDQLNQLAQSIGYTGELAKLEQGISVEMEHSATVGGDMLTIARITADHLKESPSYYDDLARVEDVSKGFKKKLDSVDRNDIIQTIYEKLVRDLYLILQRSGLMSSSGAANFANLLQQRGRVKGVKEQMGRLDTNTGQYYHEPLQVDLQSRGLISQPQNINNHKDDNNSLSPLFPQSRAVFDKITCPYCGFPTLVSEQNFDSMAGQEERFTCNSCHAHLTPQELENQTVLTDLTTTFMSNPRTQAAQPGAFWSPKSASCDCCKSIDMEMETKAYAGVDYYVGWSQVQAYIMSNKYRDLLIKFLKDNYEVKDAKYKPLKVSQIDKIILIIEEGMRKGTTLKSMSERIDSVIGDPERSDRIARVETIRVANEGLIEHKKSLGIRKVRWVSAPEDGRVCPECEKRRDKPYSIEKSKGLIPLHPGCRCHWESIE